MLRALIIALIRAYRYLLSPWIGQHCRFHPSCSVYAIEALDRHGALRGSWLTLARLGRCHPPHPGAAAPAPVPMGQPQPTSPVEFVPGPTGTPPVPPAAPVSKVVNG